MKHNKALTKQFKDKDLYKPWDFGCIKILNKKEWTEELLCTFKNIIEFWWLMNQTIAHKDFPRNVIPKELWIFRSGCTPNWNQAKKYANITELIDISFDGINKRSILDICLYCIGETIPCSDDVLGIRIKKKMDRGLNVRLWVKTNTSAGIINNFLLHQLSKFNKTLTSSIKAF